MDDKHRELLAQVAALYYEQEMTQNAIATQLGLSRVKIYRLLKEAKKEHIVQITINWPLKRNAKTEAALVQEFGLKDALVLQVSSQHQPVSLPRLGQLGARYLEDILADGATLAVCLGRSTYEVINAIRPGFQANVQVAQAMGSMAFLMEALDSATLARQLAQKLGGKVLYLASPLMADSADAAHVLRSQREIERALFVARQADVALLGIGNLGPVNSGFVKAGFITADELTQLKSGGAVGDMAGQIFDSKGQLHENAFNRRIIGVTLNDLVKIPTTIAVAMGEEKATAILGGLRTGAVDVLCTDDHAANKVLSLNDG